MNDYIESINSPRCLTYWIHQTSRVQELKERQQMMAEDEYSLYLVRPVLPTYIRFANWLASYACHKFLILLERLCFL